MTLGMRSLVLSVGRIEEMSMTELGTCDSQQANVLHPKSADCVNWKPEFPNDEDSEFSDGTPVALYEGLEPELEGYPI